MTQYSPTQETHTWHSTSEKGNKLMSKIIIASKNPRNLSIGLHPEVISMNMVAQPLTPTLDKKTTSEN